MRVYLRKQNKQKSSEYERNIAIIIIINYQYDCCFFVYTFNFELNCVFFSFFHIFYLQWRPQAIVFEIVTDKKFDIIIMLFIGLNMFTMTLDRYDASEAYNNVLDKLNGIFVVIFSGECLLKIFALRYHYFKEPWNLFDVVVVILSILGK